VDLYWIPLGAGAHLVKLCGRVFEWSLAKRQGRDACDLYHSALVVTLPEGQYMIEQTPVPDSRGDDRGVVATGPVGLRFAGRWRVLRYEIRCWHDGEIPDLSRAASSPVRVSDGPGGARRVIDTVSLVPTPTWGRDELQTGEMWNSNSVVSWVLSSSAIDLEDLAPPEGGRAPGWGAGVTVARRAAAHPGHARPGDHLDGTSIATERPAPHSG